MTWTDFYNYIQSDIIGAKESEEGDNYSEEAKCQLTAFARSKYPVSSQNEEDLVTKLQQLSISYEQRNAWESSFHTLPEIDKNADDYGPPELKTWKELYPNREECLFGINSNKEPPSEKVFSFLERIYEDWKWGVESVERLEEEANDLKADGYDKTMQKIFVARLDHYNDLTDLAQKWLTDYQKLTPTLKEKLEEEKEQVEKFIQIVAETKKTLNLENSSSPPSQKWWKKLDWKSIAVSSVIGLILILIFLAIKKFIKG